jgi:hypothetical protein
VPTLDINIAKTGAAAGQTAGTFSYTVTLNVTGTGTAIWTGAQLSMRDTLPSGVRNNAAVTNNYGATCAQNVGNPQVIDCFGGSIAAGGSGTVTIPVEIVGCGPQGNTAEADPSNSVTETNEANNTTAFVTNVTCDVQLLKTTSLTGNAADTSAGPVTFEYILTLQDIAGIGSGHLPPSTVTDTVPAGFVINSATVNSASSGSCTIAGQVVTCNNVADEFGFVVNININVTIPTSVPAGNYSNNASVSTVGDTNAANNTDSETVSVYPFDVVVSVIDITDPVVTGNQYTYTVNATNVSAGNHNTGGFFIQGGLQLRNANGSLNGAVDGVTVFADINSVSSTASVCTFPSAGVGPALQRYSCAFAGLAGGQTGVITVVVNANSAELDGFPDVSLDALATSTQPSPCPGGGQNPNCAPETAGFVEVNAPPASMTANNRSVEFTDID